MAIPWLIVGGVAAAVAAVAAVVSDDDSPSKSFSTIVSDEERKQENERLRKEATARKKQLQAYTDRITRNLAKKYGVSNEGATSKELRALLVASPSDQAIANQRGAALLQSTESFQQHEVSVASLQGELNRLDFAMLVLEELNEEFK